MNACEKPNYIFKNKETNKWEFLTHKKYITGQFKDQQAIEIPCGYCKSCLKNKSYQFSNRILMELAESKTSYFITLTYDNEHLTSKSTKIKDLISFVRKLKDYYKYHYGFTSIKYFGVSEMGDRTLRPHYHIIIFNIPLFLTDFDKFTWKKPVNATQFCIDTENKWIDQNYFTNKTIRKIWKNGNITISNVNEARIYYIVNYLFKEMNGITKGKRKEMAKLGYELPTKIQSTNLGKQTILKNIDKFKANKPIYINGKEIRTNKYIDTKANILSEERTQARLDKRIEQIEIYGKKRKNTIIDNRKGNL